MMDLGSGIPICQLNTATNAKRMSTLRLICQRLGAGFFTRRQFKSTRSFSFTV